MSKKVLLFICIIIFGIVCLFTSCKSTYNTLAKSYYVSDNYEMAITECKKTLEVDPQNSEAYLIMGKAYGKLKMYEKMNDAFTKSLEISNKYADEIKNERMTYWYKLYNEGVNAFQQDKIDEAATKFSSAVKIMPENLEAYQNLAICYESLGKYKEAIDTYTAAKKITPDNKDINFNIGRLYYSGTREYQKAIDVLTDVIQNEDPSSEKYANALIMIATSYDLLGESDKAIEAYTNALKANPDDPDLLINMARLYLLKENFDKAISILESVVEKHPDDPDAFYGIGNAYINIAKKYISKVRKTDEKGNPILSEAEIKENKSKAKEYFSKAVSYYLRSVELNPGDLNSWDELSIAYANLNKTKEATKSYSIAEVLASDNAKYLIETYGKPEKITYEEDKDKRIVKILYPSKNVSFTFINGKLQR